MRRIYHEPPELMEIDHMKVYFVGAGPGDPGLFTLKGKELLERADYCLYAGSLVNEEVLKFLPKSARAIDSSRMSLDDIKSVFEEAKSRGASLVRLHSGDPSIYSAVIEQMDILDELGIEYEMVPGISSFQASAAMLSAELTIPEVSQTVILTRVEGKTRMPEGEKLSSLAKSRATLCIFLSVHQMERIVAELIGEYGPDCPACVVYRASWPDQRVIRSTLKDIAAEVKKAAITKSAIIIVGHALRRKGAKSKLYSGDKSYWGGAREPGGKGKKRA